MAANKSIVFQDLPADQPETGVVFQDLPGEDVPTGPPESKKALMTPGERALNLLSGPYGIQKDVEDIGNQMEQYVARQKEEQKLMFGTPEEKEKSTKMMQEDVAPWMYGEGEDIKAVGEPIFASGQELAAAGKWLGGTRPVRWAAGMVRSIGNKLGIPRMSEPLLDHAYGTEPAEVAQGFDPKVGPQASQASKEAPPVDEVPGETPAEAAVKFLGITAEPGKAKEALESIVEPGAEPGFKVGTGDLVDKEGNIIGKAPEIAPKAAPEEPPPTPEEAAPAEAEPTPPAGEEEPIQIGTAQLSASSLKNMDQKQLLDLREKLLDQQQNAAQRGIGSAAKKASADVKRVDAAIRDWGIEPGKPGVEVKPDFEPATSYKSRAAAQNDIDENNAGKGWQVVKADKKDWRVIPKEGPLKFEGKITRQYTIPSNGARFANVETRDGRTVSVMTRAPRTGGVNAFGDAHPYEETRVGKIIGQADKQLREQAAKELADKAFPPKAAPAEEPIKPPAPEEVEPAGGLVSPWKSTAVGDLVDKEGRPVGLNREDVSALRQRLSERAASGEKDAAQRLKKLDAQLRTWGIDPKTLGKGAPARVPSVIDFEKTISQKPLGTVSLEEWRNLPRRGVTDDRLQGFVHYQVREYQGKNVIRVTGEYGKEPFQLFEVGEEAPKAAPKIAPPPTDKAMADLLSAQETNPAGDVKYVKLKTLRDNPDMIKVDPQTYQFKQGVNEAGVKDQIGKFDPNLSGPLTIHHTDTGDYVVDGHHRLEAALRSGSDDHVLKYQILNGTREEVPGAIEYSIGGQPRTTGISVPEARAYGALKNIADQRGSAFDMAKFMRDTQTTPEDLESMGFSLSEAKTNDAAGMSRLAPFLWDEMQRGNLKPGWAVEIGNGFPGDITAQNELYKEIANNPRLSSRDVQNLIRLRKGSPMFSGGQQTALPGMTVANSTMEQQVKILGKLQDGLESDARRQAGTAGAKGMLEKAGETKIDKEALEARAREARQVSELLPKFIYQDGSQSNLTLKKLAYDLAENPKNKAAIFDQARQQISDALKLDAENAGLKLDLGPAKGPAAEPQKSMFGGGTELAAGVPPQAIRRAQSLAREVSSRLEQTKAVQFWKKLFAPETILGPIPGEEASAARMSRSLRAASAETRAYEGQAELLVRPLHAFMESLPEATRFQTYAAMQNGDLSMLPADLRPMAEGLFVSGDRNFAYINALKNGEAGYRDNYLGQLWKNSDEEVKDAYRQASSQAGGKPLKRAAGFLQHRIYDDVQAGIDAGLTPKYSNPMDMWTEVNRNQIRYILGQRAFEDAKNFAGATFLKEGERLPKGYQYIDDRIAKARFRTEKGIVQAGSWIMPENGARVLNNFTAPGLGWNNWRSWTAMGNMFHQAWTGFHGLLTMNSVADTIGGGRLASGLGKLASGEFLDGAKDLAQVPAKSWTYGDFYSAMKRGYDMQKKAMAGEFEDPAVKDALMGGMSFKFGDSITSKAMVDAITDKLGLPGKLIKNTLGFVMNKIVVPAKLGAFDIMKNMELERAMAENGGQDLTYVQRMNIYQGIGQHLDNVMGHIARDNLNMANKTKDALGMIINYPGWNIGSIRLFGGIGRGAWQFATGQEMDQQARLALQFAAGKAIRAGLTGSIINRIVTGQWPTHVAEMYLWPNGKKDSNGNWIRQSPPEYLTRDLLSWFGHYRQEAAGDETFVDTTGSVLKATAELAASKLSWPVVAGYELYRNADFFGHPIRFTHGVTGVQQVEEILGHIAKAAGMPYAVTNIGEQRQQAGEPTGPIQTVKNWIQDPRTALKEFGTAEIGLTPAARALRQTKMQNFVDKAESEQIRSTAKSPQDFQREQARSQLRQALRRRKEGDKAPIDYKSYMQKGVTGADIVEARKQSRMKPLEAALHRIPVEQVGQAWKVAHDAGDENDAKLAKRVFILRMINAKPEERRKLAPLYRQMVAPRKPEETTTRPAA